MLYRPLGATGIQVSEIGFGGWGIGRGFWKGGDDAEAVRALRCAAERGVNFFDTALGYGRGHGERLIGALVQRWCGRLYVATKIPPLNRAWPAAGPLDEAFPKQHIIASVEASRRNLACSTIDLVQLHVWHPDWLHEQQWIDTLLELKEQQWVRFLGVSCNDHEPSSVVALVKSGFIDTVQVLFNVFDPRAAQTLFPLCQDRGVGVLARVPLDEGGLTGHLHPQSTFSRGDWRNHYFTPSRLEALETRVGQLRGLLGPEAASLSELALRFCLSAAEVSTVLVGMRRSEHVKVNSAVADGRTLSPDLLARLHDHQWLRNFYRND